MELAWIAEATPPSGTNSIFEVFDIEEYVRIQSQFKNLSSIEKTKYKDVKRYIVASGGIDLTPKMENYKKLYEEISANLDKDEYPDILLMDMYSEKETIMDLLTSLENENYIKSLYKRKKLKVINGLKTDTAIKLMDSIRQGRSLLQAARSSNMLSKPLIDFYAASAYAYASIVINSPLHKSFDSLKGSHGHTYDHLTGTVQFGGRIPSGTFIDLLISLYLFPIVTGDIKFKCSTMSSLAFVQEREIKISLIALLSSVPELKSQVMKIDVAQNIIHKLSIRSDIVKNKVVYKFVIGDGNLKPEENILKSVFKVPNIEEANGRFIINVSVDKILDITPTIYQDMNGGLWYIEPLIEGLYLPEICLHFLIISALCNIMRYSPHEWNNILSNKISSDFSLLISKYLRLFEIKYPMLVVQQLTTFLPIIQS